MVVSSFQGRTYSLPELSDKMPCNRDDASPKRDICKDDNHDSGTNSTLIEHGCSSFTEWFSAYC